MNSAIVLLLLLNGLIAFAISVVLTMVMRRLAPRLGLVDRPGERKAHRDAMPTGGGVAIFAAVWAPVLVCLAAGLILQRLPRQGWVPDAAYEHLGGMRSATPRLLAVFVGALIVAGVGLLDDRRGLSPWLRLAIHTGVALGLVLTRERISIFIENQWICGIITVLWIVGIINAFNLLDNMDGLSAGVALLVAAMFLAVAVQTGQLFIGAFLAVLIGAVGGFLIFNFPPASIFMGDCGATLIGFLVAALTVRFTFYRTSHSLLPVAVPLLILAVPLFDTASVVIIRLRSGRPWYVADRNHFSHRLVRLGMTQRRAVLTIYLVTLAAGLGATLLYHTNVIGSLTALVQAAIVIAIIVLLERPGKQ